MITKNEAQIRDTAQKIRQVVFSFRGRTVKAPKNFIDPLFSHPKKSIIYTYAIFQLPYFDGNRVFKRENMYVESIVDPEKLIWTDFFDKN